MVISASSEEFLIPADLDRPETIALIGNLLPQSIGPAFEWKLRAASGLPIEVRVNLVRIDI